MIGYWQFWFVGVIVWLTKAIKHVTCCLKSICDWQSEKINSKNIFFRILYMIKVLNMIQLQFELLIDFSLFWGNQKMQAYFIKRGILKHTWHYDRSITWNRMSSIINHLYAIEFNCTFCLDRNHALHDT